MRRLLMEPLECRELLTAATASATAPTQSSVGQFPFAYTLSTAGNVSLAIYDAQGQLVRPLFNGQPQQPGTYSYTWDGLDAYGQPLPAGQYQWRLVESNGFTRTQVANVGIQAPSWAGNHSGPTLVYADATGLYVGAVSSEGPPSLVKITPDGSQELWDSGTGFTGSPSGDGLTGLATVGGDLYEFNQTSAEVTVLNAATGAFLGHQPQFSLLHAGDTDGKNTQFAGNGNVIAVSYGTHNQVRVLTGPTISGANVIFASDQTYSVVNPGAITVASDGRVFAVSNESQVVQVTSTGIKPIFTAVGSTISSIAYDAVNADFLLVVSGGNQVLRYHSNGALIATYGASAGRPPGPFQPLSFSGITSITSDGNGGFYTAESFPRRVAHFTGRTSLTPVDQWIGGLSWGSIAAFDPNDPTTAYAMLDTQHMAKLKIDATGAWSLVEIYAPVANSSWTTGNVTYRDVLPANETDCYWQVRHVGGQTFLISTTGSEQSGQLGGVCVLRVDDTRSQLVPVAYLGSLHPTTDHNTLPSWWLAAQGLPSTTTFAQAGGYEHFAFTWSDANGDGIVAPGEIKVGSVGNQYAIQYRYVDQNWNITLATTINGQLSIARILNEGTATAPIWNWDHWQLTPLNIPADELADFTPSISSVFVGPDGSIYLTANSTPTSQEQTDLPPLQWPSNTVNVSRLMKFDAHGNEVFSVGLHSDQTGGGEFSKMRAILGLVDGKLIVMDALLPQCASVWTTDGLYCGTLSWDEVSNIKEETYLSDNYWGDVFQDGSTVYWGQMCVNYTDLYQIGGLDATTEMTGSLTIGSAATPAQAQGTGLSAQYFATSDLSGAPFLSETDPQIAFGSLTGSAFSAPQNTPWPSGTPATGPFSVRWTGEIDFPLGEHYTLNAFTYGANGVNGDRLRIWVGGQLVIDEWDGINLVPGTHGVQDTVEYVSSPIAGMVGKQQFVIEFAAPDQVDAQLHLFWQSANTDLRHVPTRYLYSFTAGDTVLSYQKYVVAVYQDVLGRLPDSDGLAYWVAQLAGGAPLSVVANDIAKSDEYYQNFVITPDYIKLLGRAADEAGLQYWTQRLQAGLTDQQLEGQVAASDEFFDTAGGKVDPVNWIDAVYKLLLDRTADPYGEKCWNSLLTALLEREDAIDARLELALGIAGSQENNTNLINDDYGHYLGRAADSGGLANWLQQFANGTTNEDVIAGFTGSAEYYKEKTGVMP